MLPFLKNHPFAVEAYFESSLVFTFAIPKAQLEERIPPCLQLDLFEDQWAFIAIAMVQTKGLRPKGMPKIFGNDFFLIGYRIFVRYNNNAGKRLRGLYILKSETDKKKMEWLGNIFTHYNYGTTDIKQEEQVDRRIISSVSSDFRVEVATDSTSVSLPVNSPFEDWKTARRFAGPLPFTFTYLAEKREVLIIQGVRQNWKPKPVHVFDYHFGFLDILKLGGAVLANTFIIENIPYYWKKGQKEIWKG